MLLDAPRVVWLDEDPILELSYQVILLSRRRILLANCPRKAETVHSQVRPVTLCLQVRLWNAAVLVNGVVDLSVSCMVGWVARLGRVADSCVSQPHWN